MIKKWIITFCTISSMCSVYGWNASGHMTAGAVAYYYLQQHDPIALQKVLHALQQHPWYGTVWADSIKAQGWQGADADIALFMYASTYSDDVRKIPELGGPERAKWHYVDLPFVPFGQKVTGQPAEDPNAEGMLHAWLTNIPAMQDGPERATDICWFFHVLEDVHQPLHTVSMFTEKLPDGDRGGNDVYVIRPKGDTVKLHYLWDSPLRLKPAEVPSLAKELLGEKKYRYDKMKETCDQIGNTITEKDIDSWIADESFMLAKDVVYASGDIHGTKETPSVLSKKYMKAFQETAERRIVVSGIRLALILSQMFQAQ
ncbi:MAG: S1/P1 nuclease [Chitinophagales bacterium]